MQLGPFRQALADHAGLPLRIQLADGRSLADHFHVTEVGRVEKRFIDCGGKPRTTAACVLQTLVAHDVDHRLNTTKLARIMTLVDGLELDPEAPVEVEHQERSVSTDTLAGCRVEGGTLVLRLAPKQTACLAEDACGIGAPPATDGLAVLSQSGCCGPSDCGPSGCDP